MPLIPIFSVLPQNLGAPSICILQDLSTGSDVLVTGRKITFTKSDNTTLVPVGTLTSYVSWPLATNPISVDLLNQDYALNIRVDWVNAGGVSLYNTNLNAVFTLYSESFYYQLTQNQALQVNEIQDQLYYRDKMILRVEIDNANNALTYGNDIASGQQSLDRAAYMISKSANFF